MYAYLRLYTIQYSNDIFRRIWCEYPSECVQSISRIWGGYSQECSQNIQHMGSHIHFNIRPILFRIWSEHPSHGFISSQNSVRACSQNILRNVKAYLIHIFANNIPMAISEQFINKQLAPNIGNPWAIPKIQKSKRSPNMHQPLLAAQSSVPFTRAKFFFKLFFGFTI